VYLEGEAVRRDTLSREHHGPRAIWNAVERLGGGYGRECAELRQEVSIAESQLRDYQQHHGQPFKQEGYQAELTALRDQLKAALSSQSADQDPKSQPAASALAERIKALRAAHTVEAAPERTPHKETAGAEPVTTRIRRKAQAFESASDRAAHDDESTVHRQAHPARRTTRRERSSHEPAPAR
jgi:hypothetical protein